MVVPIMACQYRTKDDCALWCCLDCTASGVITMDPETARLVYGVMAAIEKAHKLASRECPGDPLRLRLARPESWYSDAIELLCPDVLPEDAPPPDKKGAA